MKINIRKTINAGKEYMIVNSLAVSNQRNRSNIKKLRTPNELYLCFYISQLYLFYFNVAFVAVCLQFNWMRGNNIWTG